MKKNLVVACNRIAGDVFKAALRRLSWHMSLNMPKSWITGRVRLSGQAINHMLKSQVQEHLWDLHYS